MNEFIDGCEYVFKLNPHRVQEPSIECRMRCHGCGVKIEFDVIARRSDEDILKWMEEVQIMAGAAHRLASPRCQDNRCDLQLPAPETGSQRIGEVLKS